MSHSTSKHHVGIYGNVLLERSRCPRCKIFAFVRDGYLACCGARVDTVPEGFHSMSEAERVRRGPRSKARRAILERQDGRCIYCDVQFGSIHRRNGNPFLVRLNWDHQVPFAFGYDNADENFAAACHVCNGIKSSLHFPDLETARAELAARRLSKGYDF